MWAFLASKAIALVMVERYEEGIALSREAQRHSDFQLFSYLAEVSGLGMLGRAEEATNALERLRQVEPGISLSFIERSLPMPASESKDRFLQGFKLAGMT